VELEKQLEAAKKSGRLVVACNLPWEQSELVRGAIFR
jgi:hypothetical protein